LRFWREAKASAIIGGVMAIIIKGTPCAICGDADLGRPFTATSGVAFPEGHDLFPYCDAPLHLDCLAAWPHRVRFSRGYFEMWKASIQLGWPTLLAAGLDWMLDCGPAPLEKLPHFVEVRLADWPLVMKSRWEEWPTYVLGAFRDGLDGEALTATEAVMREVRAVAGTTEALAELRRRVLSR
jgi:hypothetical protein